MVTDSFVVDDAERARLERIVVPARRRSFLFRRAALRHVLRQYLSSWRIAHAPSGKPYVARTPLHFNASSSGELCAVAVSAGAVGVDIVAGSSSVDLPGLCERFVCGLAGPAALPETLRLALAPWHWARFEARLKLRGGVLFDALTRRGAEVTPCHEVVVAAANHVCAVARSVPFHLARLEILPFAKVAAHAG